MDLPSFDLLWHSSKKLSELESVLEEIDQHEVQKNFSCKKRFRRCGGLFGAGFAIEDRSYYEPKHLCCDQAFYTDAAYSTHLSEHVPVHDSGYFEKIFRPTTDTSVAQWREARKR
ncbi:unnamed protein product [Echinostoma caproni]|uniref:C2H2-type domain-containing protein n=1 Tax=Echinostoma caproni TaxID=27848 RepID=A0A183BB93_9TREM|nr:unnamed protein product [Echinostoma caproni]